MTQEQKAKAYDEALERAKKYLGDCMLTRQEYIEKVFPELKESKNEKIRKSLLDEFIHLQSKGYKFAGLESKDIITWLEKQGTPAKSKYIEKQGEKPITIKVDDIDAITDFPTEFEKQVSCFAASIINREYNYDYNLVKWAAKGLLEYAKRELEKQGEQKVSVADFKAKDWYVSKVDGKIRNIYHSVDKVEPKFKVGDWITDGDRNLFQIAKIDNEWYYADDGDRVCFDVAHDYYHLWTIQNAKSGDVLVNGSNIFIFHFINGTRLMGYCHVNIDDGRFYDDLGKNECFCLIDAIVTPATKEQRELLFKKMKAAGYTWDDEKKELTHVQVTKQREKDNKWTTRDEENMNILIDCVEQLKVRDIKYDDLMKRYKNVISWLEEIKERLK